MYKPAGVIFKCQGRQWGHQGGLGASSLMWTRVEGSWGEPYALARTGGVAEGTRALLQACRSEGWMPGEDRWGGGEVGAEAGHTQRHQQQNPWFESLHSQHEQLGDFGQVLKSWLASVSSLTK